MFADEGHGFERPENRLACYGVTEAFLARHLGGPQSADRK
jgi:dipeptidyl aminopeptidase/acylaminoacyl peptidase